MARTETSIENEILTEKATYPELNELTSPSQTALYRLWIKLFAHIIWIFEGIFDSFRAEILGIIEQYRVGSKGWYAQKTLEFQNGDLVNHLGEYETIDPTKRIISKCSVVDNWGSLTIKAVKTDNQILSLAELANLNSYIQLIKFAGVSVQVISLPAEPVLVNIEFIYEQLAEAQVKEAVQNAIKTYIKELSFDGIFSVNDLLILLKAQTGIVEVLINSITIDGNTLTYGDRYVAVSGHYSFNPEDTNNLYTMIRYEA
ncbi:MAG: baseplate J/gp47 family protein [Thermonemataceae bacterium]|nr:baseplate J/gp47 family protein [Thermonemataceae bacterium]